MVHLSSSIDGQGWCIDMLAFLSDGQIVGRSWKDSPMIVNGFILNSNIWYHITTTYAPSIGLQLYINGIFINSTFPFSYDASLADNYLTLANSILAQQGTSCDTNMIAHTGTFSGSIDELRVYSRALSQDDIYALANP